MSKAFLVLPDDDGIRPAGPGDACFYCRQKVGQEHKADCVMLSRKTTYGVYFLGKRLGTWTKNDPAHWTDEDCASHKNRCSWCADNIRDDPAYVGEPPPETRKDACLCGVITFKVESREAEITRD